MRNARKVPPGIRGKMQSSVSDGATVKNPTYRGKTPARTVSGAADIQRPPIPVGGKKTPATFGGKNPGGWGPGGRFGKGGWQASGKRMKKNFLAKTAEQEEESKRKQAMHEAKRRAAKTRISSLKKGPNDKQSQLLGGE